MVLEVAGLVYAYLEFGSEVRTPNPNLNPKLLNLGFKTLV